MTYNSCICRPSLLGGAEICFLMLPYLQQSPQRREGFAHPNSIRKQISAPLKRVKDCCNAGLEKLHTPCVMQYSSSWHIQKTCIQVNIFQDSFNFQNPWKIFDRNVILLLYWNFFSGSFLVLHAFRYTKNWTDWSSNSVVL